MAGTAASVLPSPVCISAMLPRASASAPRSWTSNISSPSTRDATAAVMAITVSRSFCTIGSRPSWSSVKPANPARMALIFEYPPRRDARAQIENLGIGARLPPFFLYLSCCWLGPLGTGRRRTLKEGGIERRSLCRAAIWNQRRDLDARTWNWRSGFRDFLTRSLGFIDDYDRVGSRTIETRATGTPKVAETPRSSVSSQAIRRSRT